MTHSTKTGQVAGNAAQIYEDWFVPSLFAPWAPVLVQTAGTAPGEQVLDVACGTGVVAREARRTVGAAGRAVGVDVNASMLAVAERCGPDVHWEKAAAEALPFDDASFDRVVCQFGLMFFEDRTRALREMARVLRPGGGMAIAVWSSLGDTPAFAALVELIAEHVDNEAADALRAPFCLGERALLLDLCDAADLSVDVERRVLPARFGSLDEWIETNVRGWTFSDRVDEDALARLQREARSKMAKWVHADGHVEFDAPAWLIH